MPDGSQSDEGSESIYTTAVRILDLAIAEIHQQLANNRSKG